MVFTATFVPSGIKVPSYTSAESPVRGRRVISRLTLPLRTTVYEDACWDSFSSASLTSMSTVVAVEALDSYYFYSPVRALAAFKQ